MTSRKEKLFIAAILVGIVVAITNCKQNETLNRVHLIYNNRNTLVQNFQGKSIFLRGQFVLLELYCDGKKNSFGFNKLSTNSNSNLRLTSINIEDSTGYIDSTPIYQLTNAALKNTAEKSIQMYLRMMNDYSIREVSAEFAPYGVDLKFYLEKHLCVFYVKDTLALKESWKEYVTSANRIAKNWYYYLYEAQEN
jgi:hypothetical protein